MGTDYLAVDFTVLRHDGVVMANWFISVTPPFVPDDPMSMVGDDAYGWFVINEINDLADDDDRDDDNDGIEDAFDSQSENELQRGNFGELEAGQERAYDIAVGPDTLLLAATAETVGAADALSQGLSVEIYNPAGVLIASAPPVLGRVVATALPVLPGTYTVKVRNSGSDTIQYGTRRIIRTSPPLS